ncbi:AlpA family transcriptional regulator [Kocuria sp. CNJ-770]|uniref:helix-turn-helix transcriptional regulator n=1 Tax=Kocuria sp. CNJ-770 TaxID=1904964 RepID=UPI0021008E78|nr:helix-turn-helix domain-containing protein [Kocuria sp. CNJ-770]
MGEQLAKPEDVAEYLGITVGSLAQHRYRGTGPAFIKAGRRVLYRWSSVEEWLTANTRTITGAA